MSHLISLYLITFSGWQSVKALPEVFSYLHSFKRAQMPGLNLCLSFPNRASYFLHFWQWKDRQKLFIQIRSLAGDLCVLLIFLWLPLKWTTKLSEYPQTGASATLVYATACGLRLCKKQQQTSIFQLRLYWTLKYWYSQYSWIPDTNMFFGFVFFPWVSNFFGFITPYGQTF